MKWIAIPVVLFASALGFSQADNNSRDTKPEILVKQHEPPMLGIHWTREFQASRARTKSANMTYHGGKIMTTAVTQAIFWGTSWGSYTGDTSSIRLQPRAETQLRQSWPKSARL